jgi:hypothetical protein
MHLRSLILTPALAVCLLATFVPPPALGQVPTVEEDLLSRSGDFPAIDADDQGGFVSVWSSWTRARRSLPAWCRPAGRARARRSR